MPLIGTVVLLFQAVLLAHGGLTTLGANVFSMAIVGPWAAYCVFRLAQRVGIRQNPSAFLASFTGVMVTYLVSSFQLALAFPDAASGVMGAMVKFLAIFAITQVPLALAEGTLTVIVINWLQRKAQAEAPNATLGLD